MTRTKITKYFDEEKMEWVTKKGEIIDDIGKEQVTDISSYIPELSQLQVLKTGGSSGTPLYEFPDGVDTGTRITQIINPGLDITEKTEILNRLNSEIENTNESLREMIQNELTEINNSSTNNDTSTANKTE